MVRAMEFVDRNVKEKKYLSEIVRFWHVLLEEVLVV